MSMLTVAPAGDRREDQGQTRGEGELASAQGEEDAGGEGFGPTRDGAGDGDGGAELSEGASEG
jgi:hypothetical protein